MFIQTPFGQNWIARIITKRLSKDLQTEVRIGHVDFSLFNRMHLEDVLIGDRQGDTILYAGDLKVRITDWFFFKKEAELKYVGLDHAVIKFQRTDSVWRQQFLFDYFGSSAPRDSTRKKKAGIRFDLRKLELRNVTFLKKDAWMGQDMTVHVNALNLDADKLTLSGNRFDVNSLVIVEPEISLKSYTRLKPKRTVTPGDPEDTDTGPVSWNPGNMAIRVEDLRIINGTFRTDRLNGRQAFAHFDGQHILATGVNGEFTRARFEKDTITAIMKLSARERSGFELKSMKADLKMTPQGMAFSNMEIRTNNSILKDYYSMSYHDMDEMDDYLHKVQMAAVFKDSYVDSDDIAYFAPALGDWKKRISLSGKIRGSVDALVGKDMQVAAGSNSLLYGDISLTGLPDIEKTFIDFKANDFRTSYPDAVTFVPALRKVTVPDLRRLGYIHFAGNFTGFIRDFVTFGTIRTALGTIRSDLNMKLPAGRDPVYSGKIATDNFKLGEFLHDQGLGDISLTAQIKGTGFSAKSRNTTIDGIIRYIDFNGYRYTNISLDGRLEKKKFEGVASIKDANADLIMNGIVDLNQATPRFKLLTHVTKADLFNLKLLKDSITFSGNADLDFSSINLDNFLGTARITEAELRHNGERMSFDSLIIAADYTDSIRTLTALSNEFRASISGQYRLNDLPAAVTFLLHKYYPAYISAPSHAPLDQDFNFDVETYYVDEYLKLISPALVGLSNSRFKGRLNLSEPLLELSVDVPRFSFQGRQFEDIIIGASGDADSLRVVGRTGKIQINDSLSIPESFFSISSRNDSSRVSILTGRKQALERAEFNALVQTYQDGVKIEFDPSSFTINGKKWTINENGELVLRSNTPATGLLELTESDQRIAIRSQPSSIGNGSDIKVEITNLNLADFAPYLLPKNRLEGLLSGNILVEDPTREMRITSDNISTRFLRLDNDSLGEVKASVVYNDRLKELQVKGNTVNQLNYLGFDGKIYFGDKESQLKNRIALEARQFQIKVLERFLGNLFSDMTGYLTGDVHVNGPFDELTVTGNGRLREAGLRVNFTQCYYKIRDTDIRLTDDEINLDGIILTDTITGNPVYLTGGIEHQSFRNMFYNLDISTRKPRSTGENDNRPVQLLNTTYQDNKDFYGNVKGTGSLSLLGPQSDMFMKIDAVASEKDSSWITLPPSSSRESGIADFLVERKFGREMSESDISLGSTSIIYDVDITVNKTPRPMVGVRIILDELTGDEIKGKGSGSMNIRSGTTEPLSLRGRFDIEEGSYLFTFQSFFKKPFELKKDSENYIEWNGDPYDANVKFNAVYRAERVSFAPLAQLLQLSSNAANARGDVYVVASLSEKLFSPAIRFALDFPNTSIAVTDPELALVVQQMQKNPNEINRQVTYLIVFNSFAPSELAGSSGFNVASLGLTTISGIFLNVISDQINKILGNLLKSDKYNISLNTSIYNRNIIDPNNNTRLELGSNINFSIGRSFFNNRFIITTGLGFDAPLQQTASQQAFSQQLLPDVTLEWLINQSGTIRASFFYRENTDYLTTATSGGPGKARRIGGSLSYRKDFDTLGEIFRRRKKAKPVTEPQVVPEETENKPDQVGDN
ncbi:MAG: translocation/assembly module TamB domain-containing protein [Chitinophagaceae bacterium]